MLPLPSKPRIAKYAIALSTALLATATLGQTTYVWTNQTPSHDVNVGDLALATNWSPNGVPRPDTGPDTNGVYGDEMQFDGRTSGPLSVTQNGAQFGLGGQGYGLRIQVTPNQSASVTIFSPVMISTGMRMNYFSIDPGAGGLNLGDNSTNCLDVLAGGVSGQILGFTNNSTAPSVINETTRWRLGGGGAHPFVFAGTGDWIVNNRLRSANSSAIIVQKSGSGTMTWTGTNAANSLATDTLGNPMTIGGGTMIWKTSDLVGGSAGNPNIIHNGTLLKYDAHVGVGSIAGNISGTGAFEMSAGTLTLSGQNTLSGTWTLSSGTLIAGSIENTGVSGPLGVGGTISFGGGTLAFSTNNAFDYSLRFSTAANQLYNLDTGGSSPTFAAGLSSSGGSLNKGGPGTLTLAGANTYTGTTTVGGGELVFQGTKSGDANITVAGNAALGVYENGSQIAPNTLTLGASTGVLLEFNNVTNHTTATLAPNNLMAAGMVTINVNSGRFLSSGETFPLLQWITGTAPATSLSLLAGAGGHLATNGNEIDLVIDDPPFIWTAATDSNWNTTTTNWVRNGSPANWVNGSHALLDDSAASANVALVGTISPADVTIANSTKTYALNNSAGNLLGGPGSLTKVGSSGLTLSGGTNAYTGPTTLGGGVVSVNVLANGGTASDIGGASSAAGNIVFNGGTLRYNGSGATIDRLFSVGPGSATIDNEGGGTLTFNNSGALGMPGNGPRTLSLTGTGFGDTLGCSILNHPAGTSLTKNGTGLWILTGTNTYGGGTTLLQGSLQIGAGGASGAIGNGTVSTAAGTSIDFQRSGTLLVPGAISGGGALSQNGSGTVILANNNTYTGGTTINAGTLQLGNGSSTGSLNPLEPIVNNGMLVFNTTGSFYYTATSLISGTGNVVVQGGGFIKAVGNNTYAGWTRIDPGSTFQPCEGQDGFLASPVITNNGTLRLVRQDALFTYTGPIVGSGRLQIGANAFNPGIITLTGTNTYTGGTFIGGNELVLGDGLTAGSGASAGNVQFVNNFTASDDYRRILTFNRPDDFTFSGAITTNFTSPQNNLGIVQQNGSGKLTLTGNNTYGTGTIINSGTIQVGNGGSSGSIGFGPITNYGALIFNRTGTLTVPGAVSGIGSVALIGSGTVALTSASNPIFGPTTVSNGTLVVTSLGGDLNLEGGSVVVGGTAITGNLAVGANMNIHSGTVVASLNRTASPSNSTYTVSGAINRTGGTLKLINAGPALQVGDRFRIFNQPVTGGAAMAIISPGCTVSNSLATDGSVVVTSAQPLPGIAFAVSGNQLTLSWSAAWVGGVVLQGQTNALSKGLSTNWSTIPGTDATNAYVATIAKANGTVFFRLALP